MNEATALKYPRCSIKQIVWITTPIQRCPNFQPHLLSSHFLVICAGHRSSAKHKRLAEHFSMSSTFSMKIVLNCADISSVNLFLIKEKALVWCC